MNIGKALLSAQDLSRCGWETVFPAGCGDAYLVRKASDTRITLVKERCAWYLGVRQRPYTELPYTESEEFLEMISMEQRAGVWPVDVGGSSSSSGPVVPEDVEESEPVKKLVAPTAPTTTDREEHMTRKCSEPGVASVALDVAECISIVPVEERPRFQRLPLTTGT